MTIDLTKVPLMTIAEWRDSDEKLKARYETVRHDAENDSELIELPVGTVLRTVSGNLILLGHEPAGCRTNGCDCCAHWYERELFEGPYEVYTHIGFIEVKEK